MNTDYVNKTLERKTRFSNQNFVDYNFTKTNFNSAIFENTNFENINLSEKNIQAIKKLEMPKDLLIGKCKKINDYEFIDNIKTPVISVDIELSKNRFRHEYELHKREIKFSRG